MSVRPPLGRCVAHAGRPVLACADCRADRLALRGALSPVPEADPSPSLEAKRAYDRDYQRRRRSRLPWEDPARRGEGQTGFTHGSVRAWQKNLCSDGDDGGLCETCSEARERHLAERRERDRARPRSSRPARSARFKHGTIHARWRHKCPCEPCVEAARDYYREKSREKDPGIGSPERRARFKHGAPKGVSKGYCTAGADGGPCEECRAAFDEWRARDLVRRKARRAEMSEEQRELEREKRRARKARQREA